MADVKSTLQTCAYCEKEVGTAHKCIKCQNFVHVFCGDGNEEEEGYGQQITCFLCAKKDKTSVSELKQTKKGNFDIVLFTYYCSFLNNCPLIINFWKIFLSSQFYFNY